MKKAFILPALLLALPLQAQLGPSIGVGSGVLQTDDLMASAYHLQAGAQLMRISDRLTLRGEALVQQGTANASPLSCEQARQVDCVGRTDEQRLIGGGALVRFHVSPGTPGVHVYLDPAGVGVYHLHTRSRESAVDCGPPVEGAPVCMPAPLAEFSRTTNTLSLGFSAGAGVQAELGWMRVFAEFRAHAMLASAGETGSVPVTFGVSF